jgi:hypothetical protein
LIVPSLMHYRQIVLWSVSCFVLVKEDLTAEDMKIRLSEGLKVGELAVVMCSPESSGSMVHVCESVRNLVPGRATSRVRLRELVMVVDARFLQLCAASIQCAVKQCKGQYGYF